MANKKTINVKGAEITILQKGQDDFIVSHKTTCFAGGNVLMAMP